jgi:hypothetical protein
VAAGQSQRFYSGVGIFNWALVVRAMGAVLEKKNGALWLKRLPCSRYTEMAIEMLFLTPGSDLFFKMVRKWLPVIFNRPLFKPGRKW